MNTHKSETQGANPHWAALDWGHAEHAVAIVDSRRALLQEFKVSSTLEGFEELDARLQAAGPIAGIAIEATRLPVAAFLAAKGYTLYPINPKQSKSWRECNSVAAAKSDESDCRVLALELARRHESLRPLKPAKPATAELAGLCETLRKLIDERTAHLQRLKATLRQYYPGVLPFFSDWSSPAAWRFLKRFPRPESLARAKKGTIIKFLKANKIGIKPVWLKRIESRSDLLKWITVNNSLALEYISQSTCAQLLSLQPQIDKLDRLIEDRTRSLPQARLLESLPGAGARLAPALTAILLSLDGEDDRLQALRCLSGVAPVKMQSGKRTRVSIRRRCNKHWRDILHLFARCSTVSCPWARAFYDVCRERGDRHATALRKLADKWLKIIDHMITNNQPYDDQRYVNSLRKNGSPVYQKLCEKTCG